jgi:hypothetical protein
MERQANLANFGELCSGMFGELFWRTTNLLFRKVRLVRLSAPSWTREGNQLSPAQTAKIIFVGNFNRAVWRICKLV